MSRNYDYIIVGGGASGCALASALAKKGKVLLVERGANHTAYPQSKVKAGWPQIAALVVSALRNKGSGHWTGTANVLGGGSTMNAGVCVRGQKKIFTSLGIDLSLAEKAFRFLESTICVPADYEEFQKIFEDAWKERGDYYRLPGYTYGSWIEEALRDNNVSLSEGSDHGYAKSIQVANTIMPTKDNDERRPASFLFEKSFVEKEPSILDQGNLTVLLFTQAKKIIFNDEKEAIGVDLISPAGNLTVYVRREGKVFLNAGVYETPKLLMLSGIGPRATLDKYDIPEVYKNEHVGLHLQDRKSSYLTLAGLKDIAGDDTAIIDVLAISEKTWSYLSNKNTLVWGNAFGACQTCAPIDRTNSCATQVLAAAMFYGSGYQDSGPHYLPMNVIQRHPETRGNITLASSSYEDNVIVQDGWSSNINDLKIPALNDFNDIVEGVQDQIIKFLQETSILEKLGTMVSNSTLNGEFSTELRDFIATSQDQRQKASELLDECKFNENPLGDCVSMDTCVPTTPSLPVNDSTALREIVFNSLGSTWHMTGTCRVGDVVKKGSMEVIGVKNLHISDLSILDIAVDTHPFMTAMVIGLAIGDNTSPIQSGNFEYFPVILSSFCFIIILLIPCILIIKVIYGKKKKNVTNFHSIRQSMARSLRAQSTEEVTIMEWKDVCCSYETKAATKTALFNNTGKIFSGELTALMGPSGSSKSTLLDILAGRKSEGRISGTFDVLGQHVDASQDGVSKITTAMKNHSAYIPQQEFFYPTQTCFEAVNFVANMRLGKSKNENQRKAFISLCLDDVGLPSEEFADRKIGGDLPGGISIRGLSGGERKRLVLATALALKPRVMFIDEITSGLDSENSLLIIDLLRKLSREKNVASVVIIHQPSAKVFRNFDNLLLLAKGRPVYAGSLAELPEFYEQNYDEGIPQDHDLADDLIVKAIAHQTQSAENHGAGPLQTNTDEIPIQSKSEEKIDLGRIEGTSMISENDLAESEMSMGDSENPRPYDESELSFVADESVISFEDNSKTEHFPGSSNSDKESNPVTIEYKPLKSSINSAVIDLDEGGKSYTEDFPSANKIDLGIVRDEWNKNPLNPQHSLHSSNEKENETTNLESYAQPPSYWKLTTVFKRNLKNQYLSNIANVVGRLASYTILSILIGAIFFQVGKGANSSSDGLTFTEAELLIRTNIFVLNVSYLLPFSSIPVFVGDKRFFVAESALGLYSPWMYGLSQVVLETLFVTLAAILQTCIIIPMCSMANPSFSAPVSFMTMLAVLIMSGLVGSTLVFLCSMALPSQDLAFVAGSTIVTISLALSGGFLPFSEMSSFPYALQWLSPVKYSMQALLTSQLDGTSSERLLDIGEFNTPSTVSNNLCVLVGIFLLLALLSGLAMTRLKETR